MPIRQDPIVATLSAPLKTALARTLSVSRWATYLRHAGHDEDRALRLYLWNAAIGQSFQFPLQTVEISLRNVVGQALTNTFGNNWWRDPKCLALLGTQCVTDISKADARLRKIYGSAPHTDQIVASLMFGFWAATTHPSKVTLWPAQCATAFPALPAALSIRDVGNVAFNLSILRNRIFHHEPLLGRNLSGDYGDIMKLQGWICPETEKWVRANSSVPTLIRSRPK